jgi:hypothetical protein
MRLIREHGAGYELNGELNGQLTGELGTEHPIALPQFVVVVEKDAVDQETPKPALPNRYGEETEKS